MSPNGFELPKSLDESLRDNLAEIGRQAVANNRNLSEHTQRLAGCAPAKSVRMIVFQAPGGQTTLIDADKQNRASVGFERVGAFVARDLRVDIPQHGLAVADFITWKREREAEGTVFHPVSTIF
jgi:hypothetical protein